MRREKVARAPRNRRGNRRAEVPTFHVALGLARSLTNEMSRFYITIVVCESSPILSRLDESITVRCSSYCRHCCGDRHNRIGVHSEEKSDAAICCCELVIVASLEVSKCVSWRDTRKAGTTGRGFLKYSQLPKSSTTYSNIQISRCLLFRSMP